MKIKKSKNAKIHYVNIFIIISLILGIFSVQAKHVRADNTEQEDSHEQLEITQGNQVHHLILSGEELVFTLDVKDPQESVTYHWDVSILAEHGKTVIKERGSQGIVIYTPDANYDGEDTFVVTTKASTGEITDIKVLITVVPQSGLAEKIERLLPRIQESKFPNIPNLSIPQNGLDEKPIAIKKIDIAYTFKAPKVEAIDGFDRITIDGLFNEAPAGAPFLPVKAAKILLPFGTTVSDIQIITGEEFILEGSYNIEPTQEILPTSHRSYAGKTPPDKEIYNTLNPYPGSLFSFISIQNFKGYSIVLLHLYPVQYVPKEGKIFYYTDFDVRLTTTSFETIVTEQKKMLTQDSKDLNRLQELVDNPENIISYSAVSDRGNTAPLTSLVNPSEPYDYVLITSATMTTSFQPLINSKNTKGLNARIFTTEEIYVNYSGVDNPERIRNFIIDAYTTWAATSNPLEYVLLGGDDEIVPVRYLYEPGSGWSEDGLMPSDMYYAGLDGDWDADGDGQYGESYYDGSAGEECDFFTEVYIGRMSVDNPTEATNIVNKTLAYEQDPSANYLNRSLLLGNQLNNDPMTWGGDGKDTVAEIIPQYNVTSLYDRDSTFTSSAVINKMNEGTHLVNFDGHGNWACCPLVSSQVDSLINNDYFLFVNLGCYTAAFDQPESGDSEAVAEHYIFNEHGGFAYIGNTRYGWYRPGTTNGPGEILDRFFFDTAVNSADKNIGKALQIAKENFYFYDGHRFSILTFSLFGDPEVSIASEFLSPTADIIQPTGSLSAIGLAGTVDIIGTARAGDKPGATFGHFTVSYGSGNNPTSWTQIGSTSYSPITNGALVAGWDTSGLSDGQYTLKLTVDDGFGNISEDKSVVIVDNTFESTLTVYPLWEQVRGYDWPPETEITLSIGSNQWTEISSIFRTVDFYLSGFDILPGQVVELTDGTHSAAHMVINLAVVGFNESSESVNGTANPGVLTVEAWDSYNQEVLTPIADSAGNWEATFSYVDIAPGTSGEINQYDVDGNSTSINWYVPDPYIQVYPQWDEIDGYDWMPNTEVILSISGASDVSKQSNSYGDVYFYPEDFDFVDISAGDVIGMTDGTYSRTHTVIDLSVTSIDTDTDILKGTADPGELSVYADSGDEWDWIYPIADTAGLWTADFFGTVDIRPGTDGWLYQYDNEKNSTRVYWNLVNPYMRVYPLYDLVIGQDFTPNTDIRLSIAGEVWIEESDSDGWVYFSLDSFDILPGQLVEMACDGIYKAHTVIEIKVTGYNFEKDDIFGIAKANHALYVVAWGEIYGYGKDTIANGSGYWSANFSGLVDIEIGTSGFVQQADEDDDLTHVNWEASAENYLYLPLILQ